MEACSLSRGSRKPRQRLAARPFRASIPGTSMPSRSPPPRPAGGKPGATRQQIERRERFTRARRESLRPAEADGPAILYGWHTVTAALGNPARQIRRFLATENAARRLAGEGIAQTPEIVRPSAIDERLLPDAVHQGL